MARIVSIDPETATGKAKELLATTQSQLGRTPNLYRSLANSPVALNAYLQFRGALQEGVLSIQTRERIALVTAAVNECGYCVSAHTFRGGKVGLSPEALADTQRGRSDDPKENAVLRLTVALLEGRGALPQAEFDQAHAGGLNDAEIGEVIAHIALNVFSNFFNHVAQPDLDFPAVAVDRGRQVDA